MRTTVKQNLEIARTTAKQKNFFFLTAECVCYKRHITLPSSMVHQVGHVKLTASSKQSACVLSNIKNFFPCGISCGSSFANLLAPWRKCFCIEQKTKSSQLKKDSKQPHRLLEEFFCRLTSCLPLLTSFYICVHLSKQM